LDGYPRPDTLTQVFGINNRGFVEALESRGFVNYPGSRSNYTKTWLSLASMFNGEYLHSFVNDLPDAESEHMRALHRYISHSSMMALLERRGYATWSLSSAFTNVAPDAVDRFVRPSHPTEFEVVLLQQSLFSRLLPDVVTSFVANQEKAAVYDTLKALARTAEADSPSPRFVFAHVLSPHAPFILGADGPTHHLSDCFPLTCPFWDPTTDGTGLTVSEYGVGLADQIPPLNTAILQAIDHIEIADPGGLIIVMSDHGSRYSLEDGTEQFRNILAVRSPARELGIPDDVSLVNLFRYLSDTYFGTNLQPLAYEAWLSDWSHPMSVTLVERVH
jgi:hypothetical protein